MTLPMRKMLKKKNKMGHKREFKQELIKEMSTANIALFINEHLKTIKNHSTYLLQIYKRIYKRGQFRWKRSFKYVRLMKITKHITFRYLKGRNKVRFPPQIGAKGNPVFMLFLREMLEICKG